MAAVGCGLVVVLAVRIVLSQGAGAPGLEQRAALRSSRAAAAGTRPFTVMQLNLCLSGWATCRGWAYPAVVREATTRIRQVRPDAVTLNEGCRRDARDIAEAAGYHLRFTRISYGGARLPCIRPAGRGLFGDAVLTEAPIVSDQSRRFHDQDGPEVRRWLCVTTQRGPDVCTAHLEVPRIGGGRPNREQCAELGRLLVRRAAARPVVFGGDVNRVGTCAPAGFWTASDQAATQDPGIQQVYGSTADFGTPRVSTRPAHYTDHDVLVVRADQVGAEGRR
jgi:endonuclease/exonuclease/phosphatase family metal-dependent hydrolase